MKGNIADSSVQAGMLLRSKRSWNDMGNVLDIAMRQVSRLRRSILNHTFSQRLRALTSHRASGAVVREDQATFITVIKTSDSPAFGQR